MPASESSAWRRAGAAKAALYAAAGAKVTVVDISGEMLALDRQVAAERQLDITCIQASMDDLTGLAAGRVSTS